MKKMRITSVFFLSLLILFIGCLARVDRIFFKRNHSFCIRFIYSSLPNQPQWELPPPSSEKLAQLDAILNQKFHYLAKGCHCYAFISEDKQYVIKFHRYASHMRIFPWLNHPLSYHFSEKRKAILKHNFEKLEENLQSYISSARDLTDETGIIMLHINRSDCLHRFVTLVDETKAEYHAPLDQVTFILQHRAQLIYPTLDQLTADGKIEEAKQIVSQVIQLVADCCKKGYVDEDPVLRKNYGLMKGRAIHIDIGDLRKRENIERRENYIPYVKEITESLRARLEKQYPQLLPYYYEEIERL
jgi:hypothetical protein